MANLSSCIAIVKPSLLIASRRKRFFARGKVGGFEQRQPTGDN